MCEYYDWFTQPSASVLKLHLSSEDNCNQPNEHGVRDGPLSVQSSIMVVNSAPLATEEQALSNSISQLAANVYQATQALRALDVAVQSTVVQGLTAKVQEQLRHYRSLLSDLQHAAEEQETPDQTQRVAKVLAKHQTDYDSIHKGFQEARISYIRRKEQSYVQQRQELIGSVDFSQRQQQFASEHEAEQRSQDVTASLRRTRQLMAQNLEQTHGNISVIGSGNKRLQETGDELSGQKHMFKESHGLLSTLKTQSLLDRLTVWGGFAFFMLVVLYISFKRTPAFMKQPLYALLHMKHGGKPFDHHDYASVNIPPGTFTRLDKAWAADEGSGRDSYPSEWSAWDAHFEEGSEHGHDTLVDGQWNAQDLLNEGLQQGSVEDRQDPPGTMKDELRTQQEQQQQHVEEPGTPMQHQEQLLRGQCAAGDLACHTAGGQQQQQQQPHDDVDEVAFHSGEAFHPSMDIDTDHVDVHRAFAQQNQQRPAAQQQQHHQQQHGMAGPSPWPAALGIIDPAAAAAAGGSAAADYAADDQHQGHHDQDEVEYLQQQQQQQQQHQDQPQEQQQQHNHLQHQQQQEELDKSLKQQEEERLVAEQSARAARGSAAAQVAAEAAELKAALRGQQQAPQVDVSSAATDGVAAEDQAAHAAPPGQPTATQHDPTASSPAVEPAEAALDEEPAAAAAAAQEQPPGFEPPAAADSHKPVSTEQPAAPPTTEKLSEVPLGAAAQQADTPELKALPVDAASAPHVDQQAAAEPQAPPSADGASFAAADQQPVTAEHVVADAGNVPQQQPDVVPQPDVQDSASEQQQELSADAAGHLEPEVHADQPAVAGTAVPPASLEQQPLAAAVGQPGVSEGSLDVHLQSNGAAEQERPQVHAVQQSIKPAAAEAPTAAAEDAVPEAPGPPVAAGPTQEHADGQQRRLQTDHQQQPLPQPADAPEVAEAVLQEAEQQTHHIGSPAQADSLDAAPAPAPAAVDGDPTLELKQPDLEVVQLGDSHPQQQQSHAPVATAALSPIPTLAAEQHPGQQVEAVSPGPASTSTHAAPAADQSLGSATPEVAAPVDITGEVEASAQQQQQHVVEPQQPFSTFDNEAELVHQPPAPSAHEASRSSGSAHVDAVSIQPATHHQQLEAQQQESPAAEVGNSEQPVVASAHQGTPQAPLEEEQPDDQQAQRQHQRQDQQLEVESVHVEQAKEQPELVDQAMPGSTEQHAQQQQQQQSSELLQASPAQAPAVTDHVPEHQQQQQAVVEQHPDPVAVPKPAVRDAAAQVQTAAPAAGAAEAAQRTAATITTAAEDVVVAAAEAVSVAEQVQKAVSNTGKSFGAKVLSLWGGHSGLAAIGGAKAVKQQSAGGATAVRRGGGSSFIPAAAAAEIPPPARPQEGSATYIGSGLDYHADESLSEQQAVEADTAAAPAADSKESTQYPHPINPDSLTAGELDQLSKQIEGEQQQAFTIMDMDDVGLYRYDEYGNAVLRDGLSRAAQQGGGSSGSGAASAHVEL